MNDEGNKAYREGNLVRLYEKAVELDGTVARYQSNLSAVLYEMGEYNRCMASVRGAWCSMTDSLASQAESTAFYSKNLSLFECNNAIDASMRSYVLREASNLSEDSKVIDMRRYWKVFEAKPGIMRAREAPVFKAAMDSTVELFRIGHDMPISLLDGFNDNQPPPVSPSALTAKEKERLSFLFGGFGDARHVFATVIHAASQPFANHVHMTLVDIHPVQLAKIILIVYLLLEIEKSGREEERTEIYAAISYIYKNILIPSYCCKRFMEASLILAGDVRRATTVTEGPIKVLSFISISHAAAPLVIKVFERWSRPTGKSSRAFVNHNPDVQDPLRALSAVGVSATSQDQYNNTSLFPPKGMLHLHPALENAILQPRDKARLSKAKSEVLKTWEPNPTILENEGNTPARLYRGTEDDYPRISVHPHENQQGYWDFYHRFSGKKSKQLEHMNVLSVTRGFSPLLLKAIQKLRQCLTLELVLDDVITGLPRLFSDPFRPAFYPSSFTRMRLSNIPDYTGGTLNNIVFLLPHLHKTSSSAMLWNCLINTGVFDSVGAYSYNYTLANPRDLPSLLGCRLLNPNDTPWAIFALAGVDASKGHSLPLKATVHKWLADILLYIICPSRPQPGMYRVIQPNNFAVFVYILIHLHDYVGIPSHWISEFLSLLINDQLVASGMPFSANSPLPIIHHEYESRRLRSPARVNFFPWRANLQLLLSELQPLIRFELPPNIPPGYLLRAADIASCRAEIHASPAFSQFGTPEMNPFQHSLAVVLYSPASRSVSTAQAVTPSYISKILRMSPKEMEEFGEIQILLSIVSLSSLLLSTGTVVWKMRKESYDAMVQQGWTMAIVRIDHGVTLTSHVPAKRWVLQEL
ncbi:hypothetical protein BKA70DRAFT_1329295 [Coprinopsis sp. MPI-PUGE-AT-0042]|nr:hypothetical protein BKA70DRAFT_1329295 [Coprinopsis sp. MPI-PUGE-AT-0042]